MALKDWSENAADNDDADAAINWAEGQAPSTVNGSARSMMAVVKKALGHIVSVQDYGAVGDGATDDTAAFQSAVDSGAKYIFGARDKTYLLSRAVSKTISGTVHSSCLEVDDGITLDGNGATLKLSSLGNCALLINKDAGTSQNSDISVLNWVLDGNQSSQTSSTTGDMPCLFLYDVLRARVENVRAKNVRQYAGRFLKCDKSRFNNLYCEDSDGDGWSFGISANTWHVQNSSIDNIYAEGCTGEYGTLEGNGVIFTTKYCNIGKVETVNCSGGNKIQDDSQDTTWAQSIFRGGANATSNGGTKLQGTTGQKNLIRVSVGQIISENAHSEGLYWAESTDCNIGSYVGYLNGVTGASRDVFIDESQRWSIQSIKSTGCGETNGPAISIGPDNDDYHIGSINIHNPSNRAVGNAADGYGVIDSINATDDQGSPTLSEAYVVTSTTARGRCGLVRCSRDNTGATQPRAWINCINTQYEIGRIETGSSDVLEGVVTLSNGATSTTVTSDHITKEFVGTATTDHYFHPIIHVVAWNAGAGGLVGTTAFRTTVNRLGTTGTGFAINHATAGANQFVFWKVLGWKVTAREQA